MQVGVCASILMLLCWPFVGQKFRKAAKKLVAQKIT